MSWVDGCRGIADVVGRRMSRDRGRPRSTELAGYADAAACTMSRGRPISSTRRSRDAMVGGDALNAGIDRRGRSSPWREAIDGRGHRVNDARSPRRLRAWLRCQGRRRGRKHEGRSGAQVNRVLGRTRNARPRTMRYPSSKKNQRRNCNSRGCVAPPPARGWIPRAGPAPVHPPGSGHNESEPRRSADRRGSLVRFVANSIGRGGLRNAAAAAPRPR